MTFQNSERLLGAVIPGVWTFLYEQYIFDMAENIEFLYLVEHNGFYCNLTSKTVPGLKKVKKWLSKFPFTIVRILKTPPLTKSWTCPTITTKPHFMYLRFRLDQAPYDYAPTEVGELVLYGAMVGRRTSDIGVCRKLFADCNHSHIVREQLEKVYKMAYCGISIWSCISNYSSAPRRRIISIFKYCP